MGFFDDVVAEIVGKKRKIMCVQYVPGMVNGKYGLVRERRVHFLRNTISWIKMEMLVFMNASRLPPTLRMLQDASATLLMPTGAAQQICTHRPTHVTCSPLQHLISND